MSGFDTVTFLSDLGTADESVGTVRSILRQLAPHASVIDLCHEIEPSDAAGAALMLARSVEHLAPGVVLASIGRRLDRGARAVSVGDGQSVLVGPDNGVLAAATAAVGGADAAIRIAAGAVAAVPVPADTPDVAAAGAVAAVPATAAAPDIAAAGPSDAQDAAAAAAVLHPARDVLAPAAGRLAAGVPFEALGNEIDPALLLPSLVGVPLVADDGTVTAQVLTVTRWGTVQLNVDRPTIAHLGELLSAQWSPSPGAAAALEPTSATVRVAPAGAAGGAGLALCDDSCGLLEFAVADGSAAHLGLAVGAEVRLRRAT